MRYMAVYPDVKGEGRWYSGVAEGYLPPGLLALLEKLWGGSEGMRLCWTWKNDL